MYERSTFEGCWTRLKHDPFLREGETEEVAGKPNLLLTLSIFYICIRMNVYNANPKYRSVCQETRRVCEIVYTSPDLVFHRPVINCSRKGEIV